MIVLVTDRPDCLAQTLGSELLGGEKEWTTSWADRYPGVEGGKVFIVKRANMNDVASMKFERSRALMNIMNAQQGYDEKFHKVSSIINVNADVVVGKGLTEFLEFVKA